MCGICGVFNYENREPAARQELEAMRATLAHRGPDEKGLYLDKEAGLAHQRLSIIDLATGQQPIFNEDRSVAVVCNGEIYNFAALRASLSAKGHSFYTRSDAEVIPHLYEDAGEDFARQLRGMFAIALWDAKARKMILVRDRVGIKPLFYSLRQGRLFFGSEIKAILSARGLARRIDYESLHNYLSFMTTTGAKTIFEGIQRLLPGQMLICSGSGVRTRAYWAPPRHTAAARTSPAEFLELLSETIESHLVSDVPLGAFLSGGIDSSTVVALMSRLTSKPVKTFAIGFSGDAYYNELGFARAVAAHFKTEHHEFIVTPDIAEAIPKITAYFDEPFAASSALPTFFLAQLAREKVKVVLTGDGADELLAGYHDRYLALKFLPLFDRFPFLKNRAFAGAACILAGKRRQKAEKFFAHIRAPRELRYFRYLSKFQEKEKAALYSEELRAQTAGFDSSRDLLSYYLESSQGDELNRWLYADFKTSLPDEMLTKVDRMTMAFGLEARVPFLDHVLVEYLCALPSREKLRRGSSKHILKKAVAGLLPPLILKRPKHGFEVPLDDWLRKELREYSRDYLNEARIRREGFFDWKAVEGLLEAHAKKKANLGHQLWILLMFEVWHEKYFG